MELVRLAIPRRVYTQSHIDYVAEVIIDVFNKRNEIHGMEIIEEQPVLRHFSAKLRPCNKLGQVSAISSSSSTMAFHRE